MGIFVAEVNIGSDLIDDINMNNCTYWFGFWNNLRIFICHHLLFLQDRLLNIQEQ